MIAGAAAAAVVLLAPGGRVSAVNDERPAAAIDPGSFTRRLVIDLVAERYKVVWPRLHAAHRSAAPLAEYPACEGLTPIPGRAVRVDVLRSVREPVAVPGLQGRVPGATVTFRVSLRVPGVLELIRVTHTGHLVAVGAGWRFVLPPHRYTLYRRDGCLEGGPRY